MLRKINESEQLKGYAMVFIAGMLWGSIGLFVKLLSGFGIQAPVIAFLRLFVAFFMLFPVLIIKGKNEGANLFRIDKKGLIYCALIGIFTQAIYNYCYNRTIESLGVATASILLYTAPVFVFVFSRILFKEKIGGLKILSLILNLSGCFLVVSGGSVENLKLSAAGVFLGLISAFLYSMVTIIGKLSSSVVHPFTAVFYSFLFGWIFLGILSRPWENVPGAFSLGFLACALGFALIPTVGSYIFYFGGINKNVELSKVAILTSVEPVIATFIGVLLFKELLGIINILGIVLLIISIVLLNKKSVKA